MIFGNNSKLMLKYQKAKAKLIEYNVPADEYPHFPMDSNELSFPTIYILSCYSECIVDNDVEKLSELEPLLASVAQYYDAAVNSKDRQVYNFDFLLSGATAYFLANDFGSAKVLSARAFECIESEQNRAPQQLILNIFKYLLHGKFIPYIKVTDTFSKINNSFLDCFTKGDSTEKLLSYLLKYRKEIYNEDNCDNVFYVDILIAIIYRAIQNSSWVILPETSDLTMVEWEPYLSRKNAIKMLWPSQRLIAEKNILRGENAIVQLPTGVGKTKSIELIIRASFLSTRANTAIIIAPLRALCNEITADMVRAFGDEITVNQFSDVLQNDFFNLFGEDNGKQILICTPEKLSYILHHQTDFIDFIDLFIFDEGHMFDDGSRGVTYELLVTHIRDNLRQEQQFVLLSAVLSNSADIKNWIFKQEGTLASNEKILSTPKFMGFSSNSGNIVFYSDDSQNEDFYIPRVLQPCEIDKLPGEIKKRIFPEPNSSNDFAIYNAIRLCSNGGVAIYMGQQRTIKTIFKRIKELNDRNLDLSSLKKNSNLEEIVKLRNFMAEYYGDEHYYLDGCTLGVVPHSSNIPNGIKISVEHALKKGHVSCVVCTSTLAQGVNIPIKYLLVTSLRTGMNLIKTRNFQNLIGRTARSGIYTEGSIIITDAKIYDQRNSPRGRYVWNDCMTLFDPKASEPCSSSILSLVQNHPVDFETEFIGKEFIDYIIENNYTEESFYTYANLLEKEYLKRHPSRTNNSIFDEILMRKSVFSSIENYLCLFFANISTEEYEQQAIEICKNTLAYSLGTSEEKDLLEKVFIAISVNLKKYSSEQLYNYSSAMSGIEQSAKIEQWITNKELTEVLYSEEELLDIIVSFFQELFSVNKCKDYFSDICRMWIEGATPFEISSATSCDISDIDDICNKKISYELNFFVGNICDLITVSDDSEESCVDPRPLLALLQKKIKYGVCTQTEITICEKVFNDRIIARKITHIIQDKNIDVDKIIRILGFYKDDIFSLLADYPEYFTERLEFLLSE